MIIFLFTVLAVICLGLSGKVKVNYNFADYLPDDAASTKALQVMEEEYDQPIPNMRVVVHDVTIPEALSYKKQIENVEGVKEVSWLDDFIDIYQPIEDADQDTVDEWYKNSDALYSVTVADDETEKGKQQKGSGRSSGMKMQCPELLLQMYFHQYGLHKIFRRSG